MAVQNDNTRPLTGVSLHDYLSLDGGTSWTQSPAPLEGFAGVVGSAFFRTNATDRTAVRNLGFDLQGVASSRAPCGTAPGVNDSWYTCFTAFSTPWHMVYTVGKAGAPTFTRINETTTFSGFPFAVSVRGDTAPQSGEHDFGRDGGGVATLADGTLVLTADVRWGHDRGATRPGRYSH
jgi:hypothetical protein